MIVMVLAVNFVFWRPLVAWSERFRNEQTEAIEQPRILMLDTCAARTSPICSAAACAPSRSAWSARRIFGTADRAAGRQSDATSMRATPFSASSSARPRSLGAWAALAYVSRAPIGLDQFPHAFSLGAVTFGRVVIVVVVWTLIWVPVGVGIGIHPRLARSHNRSCRSWRSSPRISCFRSLPLLHRHASA